MTIDPYCTYTSLPPLSPCAHLHGAQVNAAAPALPGPGTRRACQLFRFGRLASATASPRAKQRSDLCLRSASSRRRGRGTATTTPPTPPTPPAPSQRHLHPGLQKQPAALPRRQHQAQLQLQLLLRARPSCLPPHSSSSSSNT